MATPRKAFLSYSHDNPAHARRVAGLAHDLRRDGVECLCDQYLQGSPPEGWPLWMERGLEEADYIIVVCTPTYLRRVRKEEQPGRGLGATYEAHLIYQLLYEQQTRNDRFLPVVLDPTDRGCIPLPLRSISHYLLDSAAGYEALLRRILGVPTMDVPLVGPPPDLPVEPSPTLFPRPGPTRLPADHLEPPRARRVGLWATAGALAVAAAILIPFLKKGPGAGPAITQPVEARPTSGSKGAIPDSPALGQPLKSDEQIIHELWGAQQYRAIVDRAPAMLARDPSREDIKAIVAKSGCQLHDLATAREYYRRVGNSGLRREIESACREGGVPLITKAPKKKPPSSWADKKLDWEQDEQPAK